MQYFNLNSMAFLGFSLLNIEPVINNHIELPCLIFSHKNIISRPKTISNVMMEKMTC